MAKYAGKAFVDVDGLGVLPTLGETEVTSAGFERSEIVGDTGVLGYEEKNAAAPEIKCKVRFTTSLTPSKIEKVKSATINITYDNGIALVASEAWCAEPISMKVGDASDVTFKAIRIDEVS